jgi:hypothetical protein
VLVDALLLLIVKAAHWRKLSTFFVGDAVSLTAGLGTIGVVFATLRRSPAVTTPGAVAGLAFLALSGPLAVWSCSSLETATFTCLIALMLFALVGGTHDADSRWFDRLVTGAGVAVVLDRIDGPIYAGALIGAFFAVSDAARRRRIRRRIIWPLLAVGALYHGWRLWYFQDFLNMPLYAKVMYKLTWHANLVTRTPAQPYWLRFVQLYGWPAVAAVGIAAAYAVWRDRTARAVLIALVSTALYVSIVGDWMFGFRFFAHVMPLAAVMMALALSVVWSNRQRAAWVVAMTVVVWCTVAATAFERQYEEVEEKASWWRSRSLDERRLFGSYYSTFEVVRDRIGAGMTVAYSQAGFVPFMLELENVDTLGICSRFYAELPTRDVVFTEVGRYSPLTATGPINAEQAYLLYRDVPFIIERRDLLIKANGGRIPDRVIGGYYAQLPTNAIGDVIYRRTDRDASAFKQDPHLFVENVAHVSYLRSATVNGQPIPRSSIVRALAFLRQGTGDVPMVGGRYSLEVQFSDADVEVSRLDVTRAVADAPAVVTMVVRSAGGAARHQARFELGKDTARDFSEPIPGRVMGSRFSLQIEGPADSGVTISLTDVRVQGQTADLSRYIREHLRFAPSLLPQQTR